LPQKLPHEIYAELKERKRREIGKAQILTNFERECSGQDINVVSNYYKISTLLDWLNVI
jgi:hypothetical protein